MGKRTKDKSDEEIRSKIRRLEDELKHRQNVSPVHPQMEDREYAEYESSYNYQEELELDVYDIRSSAADEQGDDERHMEEQPLEPEEAPVSSYVGPVEGEPQPPVDSIALIPQEGHQVASLDSHLKSVVVVKDSSSSNQDKEDSVPTEILAVLGEAKKSKELLGKKIPSEISERWGQILMEGLTKEQKETLLTGTLIPENFQLTKAPKLNAEVLSILTDPAKNRDKRLEKMQAQLGCGLARLVNLTAELIDNDLEKIDIIKRLSEINQILLDLHYEETLNRRRLIIPMLDKSFINMIQGVKRDEFLFGTNLGDNIKNTKSIERSSLQIKRQFTSQPNTSRRAAGLPGNSRAPPQQPRGGGATTARAPYGPQRYYPLPPTMPPYARRPPAPPPPQQRRPPQSAPPSNRSYDRRSRR